MSKNISYFGIAVTVIAFVTFTYLTYGIIGWWCIIAGPVITAMACRPAGENGVWAWEKRPNT